MPRKKGFRIPGLSFSWKRATGLSAAKSRVSRAIGIPLTREGRRRKFGPFGLFGLLRLFGGSASATPTYDQAVQQAPASSGGVLGCMFALACCSAAVMIACSGLLFVATLTGNAARREVRPAPIAKAIEHVKVQPVAAVVEPGPSVAIDPPQSAPIESAPPVAAAVVPESPAEIEQPAPFGRTWTSADGKFSTEAEFAGAIGERVKLRKSDGTVVTLNRAQLSDADRNWLEDRARR